MAIQLVGSVRPAQLAAVIAAAVLWAGCSPAEPQSDAERLARGREIVDRMSAALGSATAFSVTTQERSERIKPAGGTHHVTLTRNTVVQRPARLYFKTSGDTENEGWYDGVGLTLVLHKDKVFGQARMPETLDKVLDAMHERYGVATPVGDFIYSSPAKALLTSTTTGGWVAREEIDGKPTDHLSFKDKGVTWDLWVAAAGDPLPVKARAEFTENKRVKNVEVAFSDWNLAASIPGERFKPTVPRDYEGIALVQRSRVLRNVPDAAAPTATTGVPK